MEGELEATAAAENAETVQSEVDPVQATISDDVGCDVSSKSVVAPDMPVSTTDDYAVTVTDNNNSTVVDNEASTRDAGAAPSTLVAPATATSGSSLQHGGSFDSSAQSNSTDTNAVQSIRQVDAPHPATSAELLDNEITMTTTDDDHVQRKDDELHLTADVTEEPSSLSNSQHQEMQQPQQHPEQLQQDETVPVQDFKTG